MPKATKHTITAAERRRRALALRQEGKTFQVIADELGITRGGAYKSVQAGLMEVTEKYRETADEVLVLELERLDFMLDKMMAFLNVDVAEVIQEAADQEGETVDYSAMARLASSQFVAVERVLKIMERRAKYLGLDKPTKIAPTDPGGENPYDDITDAERDRRLIKILTRARGERDRIIVEGESKEIDP